MKYSIDQEKGGVITVTDTRGNIVFEEISDLCDTGKTCGRCGKKILSLDGGMWICSNPECNGVW